MPVLMCCHGCAKPALFFDGFPFHFDKSPAWLSTRQMLVGLTATMSASSIMTSAAGILPTDSSKAPHLLAGHIEPPMNRPAPISVLPTSAGRNPRSALACRAGSGPQPEFPSLFFWRDVLRHQFGQDLVLSLDLLLQVGDPLLLGGMLDRAFCWKAEAPFSKNSF